MTGRLAALLIAAVAVVVLWAAVGSASTSERSRARVTSAGHGLTASIPAGWHRSRARLVPLFLPREILSVGTFGMRPGGGGNCGREPVAAIARMKTGDALVSLQEYAVSAAMRSRIGTPGAPPPRRESVREVKLRREPRRPGHPAPVDQALWSATVPFTDHGRWLDALVYVRGEPTTTTIKQIRSILDGLRLSAGTYVG